MDFQSLTRRELQTLCKKNKIPANLTNVAMADALSALEIVEGLDEIMNQTQSNPPESPMAPRTVTRTATGKKPIRKDTESAQPTTRTRRATRKTTDNDLDQENNNLNMLQTPAANTGRRKTQAASARTKVAEGSVKRVYSTRQSVRLLEKNMAGLSLKEERKTEPLKMGALDESEDKKKDESESPEDAIVSEVSSVENVSTSVDNDNGENDIKVEAQDSDHFDDHSGLDVKDATRDVKDGEVNVSFGENPEKLTDNDDGENDKKVEAQDSDQLDDLSGLDAKDAAHDAKDTEMDVFVVENSEKDNGVDTVSPEDISKASSAENVSDSMENEVKLTDSNNGGNKTDVEAQDSEQLDDLSGLDAKDAVHDSKDAEIDVAFDDNSEKDNSVETGLVEIPVTELSCESMDDDSAEVTKPEELLLANASNVTDISLGKNSEKVYEGENGLFDVPITVFPLGNEDASAVETKEEESPLTNASNDKDDITSNETGLDEVAVVETEFENKDVSTEAVEPEESPLANASYINDEEVMPSEDIQAAIVSAKEAADEKDSEVFPEEPKTETKILSAEAIQPEKNSPSAIVSGADSIATQFPRPNMSTPRKSASTKQTTTADHNKLTIFTTDDDKEENLDNSEMKVVDASTMKMDTVMSIKNNIAAENSPLDNKSLRQLSKMLKDQLQITNKKKMKNEEQNTEKTRLALQTLSENVMVSGKLEKGN